MARNAVEAVEVTGAIIGCRDGGSIGCYHWAPQRGRTMGSARWSLPGAVKGRGSEAMAPETAAAPAQIAGHDLEGGGGAFETTMMRNRDELGRMVERVIPSSCRGDDSGGFAKDVGTIG